MNCFFRKTSALKQKTEGDFEKIIWILSLGTILLVIEWLAHPRRTFSIFTPKG